jgi:DNA-binding CsgD family transcriptional regulator
MLASDPVFELAGLVGECETRTEYQAARLAWLERAVGIDASYFGAASPGHAVAPSVSGVATERVEQCEAYADRYWGDRLKLQAAALARGGVVADHDALSAAERDRMPFYREVVAGHGIRATVVGLLRARGRLWGSVFLGRTLRGSRFAGELLLLRRALPVLSLGEALYSERDAEHSALPCVPQQLLTAREQMVLRLLCRGWTNAQIAIELGSSPRTVKNQVAAILRKTGAANRTQLAAQMQVSLPRRS